MTGTSYAILICIRCKKEFTNRKGAHVKNGIIFCKEHHPKNQLNQGKTCQQKSTQNT